MPENKIILITGGAGYIGSHMAHLLKDSGYLPIILDNFSSGTQESVQGMICYEGNAGEKELVEAIYDTYPFSAIIHFAGSIQVGESIKEPLKYYQNNVGATLNLLSVMKKLNVKHIVFSSSASVYGNPKGNVPIKENCPKLPLSPYGQSKWMIEKILQDSNDAYDMQIASLRYFNVAGANPDIYAGERVVSPTNLIPVVLQALLHDRPVTVFGNDYHTKDGTCIRDFIHVLDLCEAHLLALHFLMTETKKHKYIALNLGTNKGLSVLDIIKTAEDVVNKKVNIIYGKRRPGDPAFLVADGTLAKKVLSFSPHRSDPYTIIDHAWQYEKKRVCRNIL